MRVIIAREAGVLRERLRQTVLGTGLRCGAEDCVGLDELAARLQHAPADLVFVGLGAGPAQGLEAVALAAARTQLPIFAVGLSSDPQVILQALRKGAREYLHEENVQDELLAALEKLRQAGAPAPRWGKILAVLGAKPGTGVTTVAANLAFALAEKHSGQAVLAELGGSVPELALALDLQPRHSPADLAADWDRLDATLLRQVLVAHEAGLQVLAYPPETLQPAALGPPVMRQILVLLRAMFDYTVLDLGHAIDPARLEAVGLADRVVLVVRLDVPALRLSRRLLRQLTEGGLPREKVGVVANRFGQRREFPWKNAQEAMGQEFLEWIPDDPGRINRALNQGQPLIRTARWAAITRHFDRLAAELAGQNSQATGLAG